MKSSILNLESKKFLDNEETIKIELTLETPKLIDMIGRSIHLGLNQKFCKTESPIYPCWQILLMRRCARHVLMQQ